MCFSPPILAWTAAFAVLMHVLGPRTDGSLAVTGTALTAALCCYVAELLQRRMLFDCSLGALCVAWYIASVSLRAVVLGLAPEQAGTPVPVSNTSISAALTYSFLGLLSLLLGYHLGRAESAATFFGRRMWLYREIRPIWLHTAALAGGVGVFVRSLLYWSETWQKVEYLGALPGLLVNLGMVAIGALLVRRDRRPAAFVAPVLYAVVYTFGAALMGHRGMLPFLLLMPAIYLLLYPRARSRWRRVLHVSVVLFIASGFIQFVSPLLTRFKGAASFSYYMSARERWTSVMDTYESLAASSGSSTENSFLPLHRRVGVTLEHFAVLIERTPEVWDYQYGRTILLLATKFIPRALWRSKPDTSVDAMFYQQYLGYPRGLRGGGASMTTSGDFYLNFHVPGVLLGMFTVGLLFRYFQRFLIGRGRDNRVVIAPMLFCLQAVGLGMLYASVSDLFGDTILDTLMVIFLTRFGGRRAGCPAGRRIRPASLMPLQRPRAEMRLP